MIDEPGYLEAILSRKATKHLRAFGSEVCERFRGKISRIVLFGSRARGDARRDSDYDVAVFMRNIDDRRAVNHMLAEIAYPHILKGIYIRPFAVQSDLFNASKSDGLALSIARDGIAIV